MGTLTGTKVLLAWAAWLLLLYLLQRSMTDVGIALPLPTSVVVAWGRFVAPLIVLVLLAPPIALTVLWWTRRAGAPPSR
jgi:type II secretory pathway component PulF